MIYWWLIIKFDTGNIHSKDDLLVTKESLQNSRKLAGIHLKFRGNDMCFISIATQLDATYVPPES